MAAVRNPSSRALSPSSYRDITVEAAIEKIAQLMRQREWLLLFYDPCKGTYDFHEFFQGREIQYRFPKDSFEARKVPGTKFDAAGNFSVAVGHMQTRFLVGTFKQLKSPV